MDLLSDIVKLCRQKKYPIPFLYCVEHKDVVDTLMWPITNNWKISVYTKTNGSITFYAIDFRTYPESYSTQYGEKRNKQFLDLPDLSPEGQKEPTIKHVETFLRRFFV